MSSKENLARTPGPKKCLGRYEELVETENHVGAAAPAVQRASSAVFNSDTTINNWRAALARTARGRLSTRNPHPPLKRKFGRELNSTRTSASQKWVTYSNVTRGAEGIHPLPTSRLPESWKPLNPASAMNAGRNGLAKFG